MYTNDTIVNNIEKPLYNANKGYCFRSEIKWANSGMKGYTYEIMKATAEGFPVRFFVDSVELH